MKRLLVPALLIFLSACGPTPQKVTGAITHDRLDQAVMMLAELVNDDKDLSSKRLNQLMSSLKAHKLFNLDHADELMDRLRPQARPALQPWYSQCYLEAAEEAMKENEYETARAIWKRHQKVSQQLFPGFQEKTPVLGIIDLREAENYANSGNKPKARQLLAAASKKLTNKKPFDKVDQYVFRRLLEELQRQLR